MKLRAGGLDYELSRIQEQIDSLEKRREKIKQRMQQKKAEPDEALVNEHLDEILNHTRRRMESVRGGRKGKRGRPKPSPDPKTEEAQRPPSE